MSTTRDSSVSFDQTDTRSEEMHSTIEQWIDELVAGVDDAQASDEFQQWLDVQSRFHDYSYRNTLLIKRQCPEATRVAGYRTWQEEFDRHVQEGESAIWIWAPIITKQCPKCENSPSYHDQSDCEYDETPPEEWSKGLVGFKPAPVFDVSQTEGEPLPDLDREATGDSGDLVPQLIDAADELDVTVRVVPQEEWTHGAAKGVCEQLSLIDAQPIVEVRDRANEADLARTLIHEYAHALLHFDVDDDTERSKREVEAEAVAYVVGRYCGLDTSGSAFYLAAWESDDPEVVRDRLDRISRTARELIEVLEGGGDTSTT
ncbi:ArdC-like ssDNA-binding domain-containing protein [Halomicrobium salinisoli]|uniref:ArdC-like ssDNA-binding domain-containing protein n=1 Tax=Halomicrobium salinisoli TaxID=2878391 RepID=UPI001CF01AD0|nr:ArdC-like ssDNA-binding domain-containing protein [Halomicrobium salinisoli]